MAAIAYGTAAIPDWQNVKAPAYGATGNGATDDTAAIQAAVTVVEAAGGGVAYLPAGTYRTTSTITITGQGTYLQGDGQAATVIMYYGAGDCVSMHSPSAGGTAGMNHGGGIRGLTINGASSAAATSGLNAGDWYQLELDLQVTGFTTAGSFGVHFLNTFGWTEKARGFIAASICDTCVGFDVATSGTTTATRSFGYTDLAIEMDGITGNGLKLSNGAQVYHSRLACRANVQGGAGSTYACIVVTGKVAAGLPNAGSASQIASSRLDFQAEANSGTPIQSTILIDLSNNCRIYNCTGVLDFGFGSQMALCNTSQASQGSDYFQFEGVISGDTNLSPGSNVNSTAAAFVTAGPKVYGRGQFTSAGVAYTPLGDFFALTLSQNITVSLTGFSATVSAPQRKTLFITQAASGGPYTVAWPHTGSPTTSSPTVKWAGGTAPTMSTGAGATDKVVLETVDGATWYATATQNMS